MPTAIRLLSVDLMNVWNAQGVAALHDLNCVLVDQNRAAVVWMLKAAHQGRIFDIPPTGCNFAVRGVSTLTIEQGLISHGQYI